VQLPPEPGLRIPQMFDAAIDGHLKALYVMGEDIAQTDPDTSHAREAIAACELVVVQEIFLSQTAQLADVVLPAVSFLQKDGTFVNSTAASSGYGRRSPRRDRHVPTSPF
jgi:formate dehydrogenase major subunit